MLREKNLLFSKPKLWGGIECTINRVGDTFKDQLHHSGHYQRADDIAQLASLGITALRYPVLWEYHQPHKDVPIDWEWVQHQLQSLREYNITPIAGLVHHGSGPAFTSLMDEHFAEQLAEYASSVAEKFPWLEYYTPVNEPLTTARFSGLYGLWYPHHQDNFSFLTMFLNQMKGVVLSMQAVRKINPQAKLVQTEDLAKIHSTHLLQYQAQFENERRWLTFDLLCGNVSSDHPLWNYFISTGIPSAQLNFFLDNPCPPDIFGLNYYVTSERYLDHHIEQYPAEQPGGNGKHVYVDRDAVRAGKASGLSILLSECWKRFHQPIALTEVHLCCTREEQMRWLKQAWDCSCEARQKGIDVHAVTAWSLFGAYDWNSLLTKNNNSYESGVFDLTSKPPRKTALARVMHTLSQTGQYNHPLLETDGWWKIPALKNRSSDHQKKTSQPLLIVGKNGIISQAFAQICVQRNISYITLSHHELTIVNEDSIAETIRYHKPWAVINALDFPDVEMAEQEIEKCYSLNTVTSWMLARACKQSGLPYLTFSSDLVFNGEKNTPYLENDLVTPINHYGKSKAQAERRVLEEYPSSLIIRSGAYFGPWDQSNFAHYILSSLDRQINCYAVSDLTVSPTYVPDLVQTALDLFIDEEKGIWHISNDGMISWADFAIELAQHAGHSKEKINTRLLSEMNWKAPRPRYTVLQSTKGIKLPPLDSAIHKFFNEKISYK